MKPETLIVFVKAPQAGRVKTRLARGIGAGRAAMVYRHLARAAFAAAEKGRWRTILAVEPARAIREWRAFWPRGVEMTAQGRGDLGARMKAAIEDAARGPAVIIGTDAPGVRARHIRAAFRALGKHDAVFGPARDGGYWLIGLARRRRAPRLFEGVRWSGPHALADTMKSLPEDFSVALLEELADVDEADDLSALGPLSKARPAAQD
ncbi:MAG: TIGR04282 family arsenosugar biosynthesis glycosyltransferase [Amphiplicatus sp.]